MKKIKLLLILPLLLLTGCKQKRICVTSNITNKWDRIWNQVITTGKITTVVPHHDYFFQFNEWKPYTKKVSYGDFTTYEVGDDYTFWIDDKETQYFFEESYYIVEE